MKALPVLATVLSILLVLVLAPRHRSARAVSCDEQYQPGVFVLQHIDTRHGDNDRMRKIIDLYNRTLKLECGR